jgi:hypothetical protein
VRSTASLARVSATTTSVSVPSASFGTPKATTQPRRTPSTEAAASSISCGTRLRPALMIRSLRRPQT